MQRISIYALLISVVGLVALGVVMLFSTSAYAQESHGDIYYFVKKDAFWLVVGVSVCVLGALTDYHLWRASWKIWFGVSVLLLTLCFVPHIGMKINGSHRWINLHVTNFQPSELAKIAAVFFVAWWFSREETNPRKYLDGFVIPFGVVAILIGLIAKEVDLGTAALIGSTTLALCFIAGANWILIASLFGAGIAGLLGVAMLIPERAARMIVSCIPRRISWARDSSNGRRSSPSGQEGSRDLDSGRGGKKCSIFPTPTRTSSSP